MEEIQVLTLHTITAIVVELLVTSTAVVGIAIRVLHTLHVKAAVFSWVNSWRDPYISMCYGVQNFKSRTNLSNEMLGPRM